MFKKRLFIAFSLVILSLFPTKNIDIEVDIEDLEVIDYTKHESHVFTRKKYNWCKSTEICSDIARALVYEARGETSLGRVLVGKVILNRVEDKRFPSTVYGVIRQKSQFSFIKDMRNQKNPTKMDWINAYQDAYSAINEESEVDSVGLLWYHAKRVNPYWSKHYDPVIVEGNHIFYKDK